MMMSHYNRFFKNWLFKRIRILHCFSMLFSGKTQRSFGKTRSSSSAFSFKISELGERSIDSVRKSNMELLQFGIRIKCICFDHKWYFLIPFKIQPVVDSHHKCERTKYDQNLKKKKSLKLT